MHCRSAGRSSTRAKSTAMHPLELLWVFGKPAVSFRGFAQARIDGTGGDTFAIRVAPGIKTELWGDAASLPVAQL